MNLLKKLMFENPFIKEAEYNKTLSKVGKPSYYSYSDYKKTRILLFDLQTYPSWYFIIRLLSEKYNINVKDSILIFGMHQQSYYRWHHKVGSMGESNLTVLLELYEPIVDLVYNNIIKS